MVSAIYFGKDMVQRKNPQVFKRQIVDINAQRLEISDGNANYLAFCIQDYDTWENWYDPTIVNVTLVQYHTKTIINDLGEKSYDVNQQVIYPRLCTLDEFKASRVKQYSD